MEAVVDFLNVFHLKASGLSVTLSLLLVFLGLLYWWVNAFWKSSTSFWIFRTLFINQIWCLPLCVLRNQIAFHGEALEGAPQDIQNLPGSKLRFDWCGPTKPVNSHMHTSVKICGTDKTTQSNNKSMGWMFGEMLACVLHCIFLSSLITRVCALCLCAFRYSIYPFSILSRCGIKHPKPVPFLGNMFMFRQVRFYCNFHPDPHHLFSNDFFFAFHFCENLLGLWKRVTTDVRNNILLHHIEEHSKAATL